jgi:hypothetical protein
MVDQKGKGVPRKKEKKGKGRGEEIDLYDK